MNIQIKVWFTLLIYLKSYLVGFLGRESMNGKYGSKQTNFERTWMSERPGRFVRNSDSEYSRYSN